MITLKEFEDFIAHIRVERDFIAKVENLFGNVDCTEMVDNFNNQAVVCAMLLNPDFDKPVLDDYLYESREDFFYECFWNLIYEEPDYKCCTTVEDFYNEFKGE